MTTPYILETQNLKKQYGQKITINNLNLQVEKGSIYGFLGPNGAGKTTTMRMILGLTQPTAGEIYILGASGKARFSKISASVGAIIETPGLYGNLSGEDNLKVFAKTSNIQLSAKQIEDALAQVELTKDRKVKAKHYSMGMKQRLGIASALLTNPALLILDEPMNGLDPFGIQEMRHLIKRLHNAGQTIVFSSHLLNEAEQVCTHLGILNKGELIIQGTLKDVLSRQNTIILEVTAPQKALPILIEHYEVKQESNLLHIVTTKTHVPKILALMHNANIDVLQVYAQTTHLEDFFSHVVESK